MRVIEMLLRDASSSDHAGGRKRYSETDRSKKKNICVSSACAE